MTTALPTGTPDLRNVELQFAYEHAGGIVEGYCLYAGNAGGNTWYDLKSAARAEVSPAVAYLESRGLLQRHPVNPSIVRFSPKMSRQPRQKGWCSDAHSLIRDLLWPLPARPCLPLCSGCIRPLQPR